MQNFNQTLKTFEFIFKNKVSVKGAVAVMDRRKFNPLCHIDHTTIKSHHSTPNDPASSLAFRAHRTHKSVIICNPFKLSQRSPPPLLPQPFRGAQEVSQDFLPYKQKITLLQRSTD
ncbi:hypothetical protein CEXT_489401 [Caerostris extrusa]|uniref:Uncharacterized protein n=1 Tax=Caerostris extrusa TaxID=172846 RepID=A0AAV4T948_CAEEX|nr:hypothetical protein CEXT_489401 [Caerostris extrusa]